MDSAPLITRPTIAGEFENVRHFPRAARTPLQSAVCSPERGFQGPRVFVPYREMQSVVIPLRFSWCPVEGGVLRPGQVTSFGQ